MKLIKIKSSGEGVTNALNTEITTADGEEIKGLANLNLSLSANGMATVTMSFVALGEVDLTAHPILNIDTIREAAALHGFDLVEKKDDEE